MLIGCGNISKREELRITVSFQIEHLCGDI